MYCCITLKVKWIKIFLTENTKEPDHSAPKCV